MNFKIFFIMTLLFYFNSHAKHIAEEGLPFEPDTTIVKINKIQPTKSFRLEFNLMLPEHQGLNKGAPSFVAVFEKLKGQKVWTETKKIKLNEIFSLDQHLSFSKDIDLQSADSDVAIFSTIFHCDKNTKKKCYIQGFEAKTKRSTAKNSLGTIPFYIEGKMN